MGGTGSGGHARVGPVRRSALLKMGLSKEGKGKPVRMPLHLSDEEQAVWKRYAPLLSADGRLTEKTAEVLSRYCTAVTRCRRLTEELRTAPSFVVNTTVDRAGNEREIVKAHPIDSMLRQWMATSHSLENDLLLNPASSMRATFEASTEVDPFDQFEDEPDAS